MIPRPPTSTLFPYTTLFRSDLFHYLLKSAFDVAENNFLVTLGITPNNPSTAYGYIQQGKPLEGEYKYPDRKSTRLNSSHSQISYAVFCLKKKKIKIKIETIE